VPAHVYPVLYLGTRRDSRRNHHLGNTVDDGAIRELMEPLRAEGFVYGDTLYNTPPKKKPPMDEMGRVERQHLAEHDLSFVEPGDLLVQATRPPIHDELHSDRKRVQRGYTDLEERIFALWSPYIDYCCRSRVDVSQIVAEHLRPGYEDRAVMEFYQNSHCGYKHLRRRGHRRSSRVDRSGHTAAFLLRLDEAWPGGPGYLGAFGMDGKATQVWTYLLPRDMPQWLCRTGFTMVELEQARVPARAFDLRWAFQWKVKPLAYVPAV